MSLYLWIPDPNLREAMRQSIAHRRPTDSGVDLLCPGAVLDFSMSRTGVEIHTGLIAVAKTVYGAPAPLLLLPRSSTSKTPLRLSNSIGLVDMGYRGELMARVDCVDPTVTAFAVEHGRRLFQIVQHDCMPFLHIHIVDGPNQLPPPPSDGRGEGGFGSTGQ
jgi:dUTP pyrophosphatase